MEKKATQLFISQFTAIDSAVILLKKGTQTKDVFQKALINEVNQRNELMQDEKLLWNTIEEIENNLYAFPDKAGREIYIKNIIRLFANYASYFDVETKTVRRPDKLRIGENVLPGAAYTLEVIEKFCTGSAQDKDFNEVERYIVNCFIKLTEFSSLLDAKCLSFEINIQQIQDELNIHLQRRRKWDVLSYYGIKKSDVQENENNKPEIKPFFGYLNVENPSSYAKQIKSLLRGKNAIDYAALIFVLQDLKILEPVSNKTELHSSMVDFFGENVGNLKGFSAYLKEDSESYHRLQASKKIESLKEQLNNQIK